jgi:LacI family transcriptional regulator
MASERTLRVFVAGIDIFYAREMLLGIQEYSQSHGSWQFYMGGIPFDRRSFSPFEEGLSSWKPDGMIVSIRSQEAIGVARNSGLPVVNVSSTANSGFPTVIPDNLAVGRMAAQHLMDRGLRNYAYSHSPQGGNLRVRGFVRELAKHGHKCMLRYATYQDSESERRDISNWLLTLPKPVGIMSGLDDEARQLMWACQLLGLRIPEDVAVLGVGNQDHAGAIWKPGLSSIELGLNRVGYRAAELLDRLVHGKKAPNKPILIDPLGVVTRESTDLIATNDQEISQAVRMIRESAHRPLSVKEILAQIPISRRSFERRFFKVVGRSPRAEITRCHLELAKRLLRESPMPIPKVAESVGFSNRMAFSTFFRRETGLTPSEFRTTLHAGRNPPTHKKVASLAAHKRDARARRS